MRKSILFFLGSILLASLAVFAAECPVLDRMGGGT